jgi:crotonobetainyl-CoA:carnitine CoA-transferase CaiB-like acyl-CoA transferase
MLTRSAAEWEAWLQERHVPAARVRTMGDALADPQIASRGVLHRHESAPGIEGGFAVPVAAFKFAHDGPRVDRPPPMFGQHTDEVLGEVGYSNAEIARFRAAGVV